jgi:centromeric protein E
MEASSTVQSNASGVKRMRPKCDMGPLLPFEELVNEIDVALDDPCKKDEDVKSNAFKDCSLPASSVLLHVTNRRTVPLRKKSLPMADNELVVLQSDYEDLLLKFETQSTMSEIQNDCLSRKLAEADLFWSEKSNDYSMCYANKGTINGDKNFSLRESEAILVIKRLQEQIKMLEMERSSNQQNLDSVVELATERNICARKKFEELYEELQYAQEEARMACEKLTSDESERFTDVGNSDFVIKLSVEVQELMSEFQNSELVVESVSSLVEEVSKSFSALFDVFHDFRTLIYQSSQQQNLTVSNYEKLTCHLRERVSELENEKLLLYNQSVDIQKQIQELTLDAQNSEKSLKELLENVDLEKLEFLLQIRTLKKEISSLSSCSLAKEKENLRKDNEKTKAKLKETDFKLKNAIQEKTKLEGEKASAEREIKRLLVQNSLLERDISKRGSLACRRRDSVIDRTSKVFEQKLQVT